MSASPLEIVSFRNMINRMILLEGLILIVLFGGFARGEVGRRSDIDLLLLFETDKDAKNAETRISEITTDFGERYPQVLVRSYPELRQTSPNLLENIFKDGRILYLRYPLQIPVEKILSLKLAALYQLDTTKLGQLEKVALNKILYGKKERKLGKSYEYTGRIAQLGGERVGRGTFIVPAEASREIEEILTTHGASFRKREIWLRL
jgi:predicted nucleotidyltransferase